MADLRAVGLAMFKNLRTGTKLLILCGTFIVSILVPVYALVDERRVAIDFARKELDGSRYLATIRSTYAAVLAVDAPFASSAAIERNLATAEGRSVGQFQTAALSHAFAAQLRGLAAPGAARSGERIVQVLASAEILAWRIGDDSNLALDPDLDSYYLQYIVSRQLPDLLGRLVRLQSAFELRAVADEPVGSGRFEQPILASLVRSTADGVRNSVQAAYRGNADGRLKQAVDGVVAKLISSVDSYLAASSIGVDARDSVPIDRFHATVVRDAMSAWQGLHGELDRLLQQRITDLTRKMSIGLVLIAAVAGISICIAALTHQHIVRPLQRLETVALKVRASKDYNLRAEHKSNDEIGRVTNAFNDMLAELATARRRETAQQAELARAMQLTTMGEMAASIAHEVNQPLSAIVTNGNAGLRWLTHATPDLSKVQGTLQRIVRDGLRAGEVIASVRAMFKKDSRAKSTQDVGGIVKDVLRLVREDLEASQISLETVIEDGVPQVTADRVQIQQVVLNLVTNAIDAICGASSACPRRLRIDVGSKEPGFVAVVVKDSGPGIAPQNMERVLEPFFTTKAAGMGLGLSICRSIVEAHGGRLSLGPATPRGTAIMFTLPILAAGES
jgi:signal transduction histidine kinase